jgi:cobalamin biosynthesis Mg chelatase CobN
MRKNSLKTAILAGALVVFSALPSFASAGEVVPPGNSAATQYTQVFPTSGGNVAVGTSIGESNGGGQKPPAKVIGKKTTQELESQGPEGKAVAQLAAESAPSTSESETSESSSGGATGGGGGNSGGGHHGTANQAGGGNQGGANAGGGAQGGSPTTNSTGGAQAGSTAAGEAAGSGSSGFSEVLGQATGSSSGQMGSFLPLVLLAALALALVYAWRRRQHGPKAIS